MYRTSSVQRPNPSGFVQKTHGNQLNPKVPERSFKQWMFHIQKKEYPVCKFDILHFLSRCSGNTHPSLCPFTKPHLKRETHPPPQVRVHTASIDWSVTYNSCLSSFLRRHGQTRVREKRREEAIAGHRTHCPHMNTSTQEACSCGK